MEDRLPLRCVWLALIPWYGVLVPGAGLWMGAGFGVQVGVFIGWLYMNTRSSEIPAKLPLPAACAIAYVGLLSGWAAYLTLTESKILTATVVVPLLSFLALVAAYLWISSWPQPTMDRALKWLRYSLALMVVYGWMQVFNLDQFQANREVPYGDVVGGPLGNESHFAPLLALCLPFWMTWRRKLAVFIVYAAWGLIGVCGSATGFLTAALVSLWVTWHDRRWIKHLFVALTLGIVCLLFFVRAGPTIAAFLNPEGRLVAWQTFFDIWRNNSQITGFGLGAVEGFSAGWPTGHVLFEWRHVHNEYLQTLFEFGIFGLALLGWVLCDLFRQVRASKSQHRILYSGVLIGILVGGLTNYPWHLWVPGMLALLSYTRLYAEE